MSTFSADGPPHSGAPPAGTAARRAAPVAPPRAPGPRTLLPAALLVVSLLVNGCTDGGGAARGNAVTPAGEATATVTAPPQARHPLASLGAAPRLLPGLGPRTSAAVPAATGQALVVAGRDEDAPESTAVLYERLGAGWEVRAAWPARNALRGWTRHHLLGDLRSPVGVFTLTDAGGLLPDPGTRLPYHRSGRFTAVGTGFEGEPLRGSFDHVIAIDYNRVPGTTPLDGTRPLGAHRGGGIWLHVDHGGPTHGCVALRENDVKALLRALDPELRPVVVMGDAASLAR
ncbi:lipoprotein [Streptomyces minutiscleroticus]|uniref:Lipoprotein n=2 Tax=Streptomyces minutiscleroticus TaxID=68238 RepID=A0A918NRB8_9ACTN|nr:L,D-transpeptidase family protein [Streptomyces minutiscleroticus]GGX89342.1 lipoprotein [Streptomyces minutiscleroticus]